MRPNHPLASILAFAVASMTLSPAADAGWKLKPGKTKVQSMPSGGPSPDFHFSHYPVLSSDGRHLLFLTSVASLTGHVDYGPAQLLWKNRETGQVQLVSATSGGDPSPLSIHDPQISADGRYCVFSSDATNLPDGITVLDVLGHHDVFRVHLESGTTVRVSVTYDTKEPNHDSGQPDISADGRYVVFQSNATNLLPTAVTAGVRRVYRKDMNTGVIELVSVGPGDVAADANCHTPRVSDDGRLVAFNSFATNLGQTPIGQECWVRDMVAGTNELVSANSAGAPSLEGTRLQAPAISGDGRYVAFASSSDDLPGTLPNSQASVYVRDRKKGKTVRVKMKAAPGSEPAPLDFSAGRFVVIRRAANGKNRLSIYDAKKKKIHHVDLNSKGKKANGTCNDAAISGNGKVIAFTSSASNLGADKDAFTDVFVRRWK